MEEKVRSTLPGHDGLGYAPTHTGKALVANFLRSLASLLYPNQHPWRSACLPRDASFRLLRRLTPQSPLILPPRSVRTHPASGTIPQMSQRNAYHPSPYHPGPPTAHAKLAIAHARRHQKWRGQEDHRRMCSRVRLARRSAILWTDLNERGCDSSCG